MKRSLYDLLEHPIIYRWCEMLLAPGARQAVTRRLQALLQHLPPATLLLDVGCGPSSWLGRVGLQPIGVDLSRAYIQRYAREGPGVVASVEALPFAAQQFDAVWSLFLLHHLSDALARQAVREMVRVCRRGGHVIVIDGVFPRSVWQRPVSYVVRRLDRGRFMRHEDHVKSLLPTELTFTSERMTYTLTGHELVVCQSKVGA